MAFELCFKQKVGADLSYNNIIVSYLTIVHLLSGHSLKELLSLSIYADQRPARIEIHPNDHIEINAGNSLVLTCVGYGVPLPFVYWSRGDMELANNSRVIITKDMTLEDDSRVAVVKLSMEICSSRLTDAGVYSCTAVNDVGNNTFTFMLSVRNEEGKTPFIICLYLIVPTAS